MRSEGQFEIELAAHVWSRVGWGGAGAWLPRGMTREGGSGARGDGWFDPLLSTARISTSGASTPSRPEETWPLAGEAAAESRSSSQAVSWVAETAQLPLRSTLAPLTTQLRTA